MKRIVIIEDQTAVREMIAALLRTDPGYEIVGEAGDGQAGVEVCLATTPDIAVLDDIHGQTIHFSEIGH